MSLLHIFSSWSSSINKFPGIWAFCKHRIEHIQMWCKLLQETRGDGKWQTWNWQTWKWPTKLYKNGRADRDSSALLFASTEQLALLQSTQIYFDATFEVVPRIYCQLFTVFVPSVLWHCWLGGRKGIRPVKNWVVGCWHGYLYAARCRLAHSPADATATHCLLLQ